MVKRARVRLWVHPDFHETISKFCEKVEKEYNLKYTMSEASKELAPLFANINIKIETERNKGKKKNKKIVRLVPKNE